LIHVRPTFPIRQDQDNLFSSINQLRSQPRLKKKLWLGHANKDVTDRYAEQLKEDVEWRKEEAEKAGLGVKLPSSETVFGLLGLPKQQKSKLKKAA
jgi:hypothetical protein